MEAILIFLFLFFSILLAYLALRINLKILMGIPFIILVILGINIMQYGYDTQTTFNTYEFNYTYYADSNTNEITGMNVTKTPVYVTTFDLNSQVLGIGIVILGFAFGFLAAFG